MTAAKRGRTERLQIIVAADELGAIDDFRFRSRMPSRTAAVRELLRRGLASAGRRKGEGRKRAKARGVKFGRPRKMTPHQRQEALQRLAAGETMPDLARTYNVDAITIGRLAASSPFEHGAVAL